MVVALANVFGVLAVHLDVKLNAMPHAVHQPAMAMMRTKGKRV
jgi:hypothetical protein